MTSATDHQRYMQRALSLAARGRYTSFPNPRVGCVIVRGGEIVGEGWHAVAGEPHAEVHALRMAGERARGADVYVTLEPCAHHGRTPPCAEALVRAAPARVFVASPDPNPLVNGGGIALLRAAGIEVITALMRAEADALNRGFLSRMTRGRPWLSLKLAQSLDGRTAMASGESQWITSADARADVHRLRAEAGCVLTASGTAIADDPALTVRLPEGALALHGTPLRQPDRVVLDGHARVPASAAVWRDGARRFRVLCAEHAPLAGVTDLIVPADAAGRPDLAASLQALGGQGVNSVLVECGPRLAGALIQADLLDELIVYLAPSLLGPDARPLMQLSGLERLSQRIKLRWTDVTAVGSDLRLTAVPA